MNHTVTQMPDPKQIPADWRPSLPARPPAPGPWKHPPAAPDPLRTVKEQVLAVLCDQRETVYGVFDGARDDRILGLLREYGIPANLPDDRRSPTPLDNPNACEYESLYVSRMKDELANVGPWLVRLPRHGELLKRLVLEGWGQAWGWYMSSSLTLLELRRHFRHFLLARLPDGRAVMFRFYDPRVLGTALAAFDVNQRTRFCRGLRRIVSERPVDGSDDRGGPP